MIEACAGAGQSKEHMQAHLERVGELAEHAQHVEERGCDAPPARMEVLGSVVKQDGQNRPLGCKGPRREFEQARRRLGGGLRGHHEQWVPADR